LSGFPKTGINSLDLTDIGFVSTGGATFVENTAGTSGRVARDQRQRHRPHHPDRRLFGSNFVVGSTAPAAANVAAPVHAFIGADAGAAFSGVERAAKAAKSTGCAIKRVLLLSPCSTQKLAVSFRSRTTLTCAL